MPSSLRCIALIDDDRSTNFFNRWLIQKLNVAEEVLTFYNGKEALTHFQEQQQAGKPLPDLVFLDVNMPVMNGFEFLEAMPGALANPDDHPRIILMLTNSLLAAQQETAAKYPIEQTVHKPLDEEKVRQIVDGKTVS